MARLELMSSLEKQFLEKVECPTFSNRPWINGPPLDRRRVAVISTAGIHAKKDRPFTMDPGDFYRIIPGDIQARDWGRSCRKCIILASRVTCYCGIAFSRNLP